MEAIADILHRKPAWWQNKGGGLDPDQSWLISTRLVLVKSARSPRHGRGVLNLLEHVLLPWMEDLAPQKSARRRILGARSGRRRRRGRRLRPQSLPIKLAIVSRSNVGKSTLTNRILGRRARCCLTCLARRVTISTHSMEDATDVSIAHCTAMRKQQITDAVEVLSNQNLQAGEGNGDVGD